MTYDCFHHLVGIAGFGHFAWALGGWNLFLGIFALGYFALVVLLGTLELESLPWDLSLGTYIFGLEPLAWNLWFRIFRFAALA